MSNWFEVCKKEDVDIYDVNIADSVANISKNSRSLRKYRRKYDRKNKNMRTNTISQVQRT